MLSSIEGIFHHSHANLPPYQIKSLSYFTFQKACSLKPTTLNWGKVLSRWPSPIHDCMMDRFYEYKSRPSPNTWLHNG
jgi:hypothetical protein